MSRIMCHSHLLWHTRLSTCVTHLHLKYCVTHICLVYICNTHTCHVYMCDTQMSHMMCDTHIMSASFWKKNKLSKLFEKTKKVGAPFWKKGQADAHSWKTKTSGHIFLKREKSRGKKSQRTFFEKQNKSAHLIEKKIVRHAFWKINIWSGLRFGTKVFLFFPWVLITLQSLD